MTRFFTSLTLAAVALTAAAETPLWMRDIRIAPDGHAIAFTYMGDIYTVPADGGTATRLTTTEAYEASPVWSPDSRSIAFASDREGGMDVYVMDARGGRPTRLTFNSANETPEAFTPDGTKVIYSAGIQLPASSGIFPRARNSQLYEVGVQGGRPRQILGSPAHDLQFLPDGRSFLYMDDKGIEDQWRKHHTSSVTRDLWKYDASTGKHTCLTNWRAGEDRNPVLGGDGKTVYFLSERNGGTFNVYSFPLDNPANVKQVTSMTTHPVRFLSRAADGKMAFGYDGEIYTFTEGSGAPRKLNVDILRDDTEQPLRRKVTQAEQAAVSPDGKQVAFVSRGDIFVTSADYATTRRVTSTPQGEAAPSWGADNRTLYYTSDRDGHYNIYRARIERKADPNFPNATLIEETAVFPASDGIDRQKPLISPDGQKMAFIQDGRKIGVMDLQTRKIKMLTQGETYTYRDGDIEMEWSPDSEWLVATIDVHQRSPYYDIAIFNATTGEMTHVTNDAYMNSNPHWVMGGNAIIFETDRYGMKNHASWGATSDIMIAFTNRDTYDRARLSEEDYALLKEAEKSNKKDKPATATTDKKNGKKGDKKNDKKDAKADADKDEKPSDHVNVETDGIEDRLVRITPFSSTLGDAYVDKDGEALYFMAKIDNGFDMWKRDLRKGDVSLFKKLGIANSRLVPDSSGKNLFILGSSPKKLALAGGKLDNISISGNQELSPAEEREYMYDYILANEAKRFLVEDMFGCDWQGLGENYRKFLPHINNNYDFAEMASELLGELNVSHTGCGYRGGNNYPEPTGSLGLLYDLTYTGDGLRVAEIIKKGPFDRASSAMVPGAVITAIDGQSLGTDADPLAALNSRVRTKTLVSFTLPSGKTVEEVILPASASAIGDLLYDRWVERNRHIVDSISGGRLGYVHLQGMNDASYRTIYADVLGRYADRDGIVIDTRFNGGGRLHEDIEVLFSGKKYLTQEIRGVKSGEMPSKRWLRPSIMVTGEANYSNAHGTPWMYRHCGLGKIVGMPVPGTMSSVNWITLQDPSMYFGVPIVGFRTAEGTFLENQQLEPDVRVANDPTRITLGIDDQLETAVRTLLDEIDGK